MIFKSISFFSASFVSFIYYWFMLFQDNGVTATLKVPENIKPGETVTAEVIINKGNTGGFAKLQIETSQNINITEEDNKGATFSFSGNTAKWIWTALPMAAEFKVKFKITANASATGSISISGKFSYIVNNAKQVTDIPAKTIFIGNASEQIATQPNTSTENTNTPTTTPKDTSSNITVKTSTNVNVSVNTSISVSQNTTPTISETSYNVNLSRKIENIAPNTWLIKITINKNEIKGFARYTDVLPSTLTAKAEDKDGSSFFVDGNSIKFVWSNLPEKQTLNISYRVSGNITAPVTLNGDFSYTENNQVMSKTLPPESIQPTAPVSNVNNNTAITPINTNIAETSTQAKQTAVFFSVQLGAFMKSNVSANYFVRKYNIKNVQQENHEAYKKFFSGNFDEYKKARDYREEIKLKGIQDAFVIAHKNNNIRITVQEALMITNQKWYP